ncbi:MAG: EutN/CcmL family microcompartment protein [Terriglobales bacterium]
MFLARVVGCVIATVKDPGMQSHKLLLVRPLPVGGGDARARPARTLVALDAVGAGVGETVTCCRGKEASLAWRPAQVPTDLAIVGILDPASNRGREPQT